MLGKYLIYFPMSFESHLQGGQRDRSHTALWDFFTWNRPTDTGRQTEGLLQYFVFPPAVSGALGPRGLRMLFFFFESPSQIPGDTGLPSCYFAEFFLYQPTVLLTAPRTESQGDVGDF